MSIIIASKYAKALVSVSDENKLEGVIDSLKAISLVLNESKAKDVIFSPIVSKDEKLNLLVGENADKNLVNLVKLLIEKKRLNLVGDIYESLRFIQAKKNNSYNGFIYSQSELDAETLSSIKSSFDERLSVEVSYKWIKSDLNGFKITVPDLGVEVNYSQDRIKEDLVNYILKAI